MEQRLAERLDAVEESAARAAERAAFNAEKLERLQSRLDEATSTLGDIYSEISSLQS